MSGVDVSTLEIRELEPEDYRQWDELVDESSQGTIFHKSFWLETCSRALSKSLRIYGCFDHDRLIAGCSLFVSTSKTGLYKRAESTVGMSPYGGLLFSGPLTTKVRRIEETYNAVIRSLTKTFAEQQNFQVVLINNSPGMKDVRAFTVNGWTPRVFYTYYFDTTSDIENKISKKVRRTITNARNANITIKNLTKPDPETFSRLFSMTFRRQEREPPFDAEFFTQILDKLVSQRAGEMWIAEMPEGEVACAEIIVWDTKRAYRWAAASHADFRKSGAVTLLLYEIFKSLRERSFKEIDLMAATMPNLANFIAGFNPRLVPYYPVEKKTWLARNADRAYAKLTELSLKEKSTELN